MENFESVEAYIAHFPEEVQNLLKQIRVIIKRIAPDSVEGISYGMPAYKLHKKPLVYFAAFKKHIGFYATPSGHTAFSVELAAYKQGKGSVQFPLNKPIPYALIEKMVAFRVEENRAIRYR
ncbi:DUF1801 domain-containing protein [Pedobacter aquae]|uniref:DUF1801 domain-containing protein n=1 Tax=Pedobacter aquae TaxID=2605747 RepID=A0A5C0VJF0_9SPHI|nr:DUF1801 domain-containing protein [Pedobacter aquae]QEK52835.1 DUF1801 domain-containing protein [Pedobacter aquae]